jgi:hypothetical protein
MSDDVIKLLFFADFQSCFERASGSRKITIVCHHHDQKMKTTCVWEDGDGGTK